MLNIVLALTITGCVYSAIKEYKQGNKSSSTRWILVGTCLLAGYSI